MKRKHTHRLFLDQFGDIVIARTVRELREKCGGGKTTRMYIDRNGLAVKAGYVVGNRWFTEYAPVEVPA
jgi:putative component of toxin-antitoxin plasmid stabilization module